MSRSQVTIYTDGASRGNPGRAAVAFYIDADGQPRIEYSEAIGLATNNVAEYMAMIRALNAAREFGSKCIRLHSDSELMVKQMRGEYRVKHADIIPLYEEAKDLLGSFERVEFIHVPREQNSHADRLCNDALDGKPRPLEVTIDAAKKAVIASPSSLDGVDLAAIELLENARIKWASDADSAQTPAEVWSELRHLLKQHKLLKTPRKKTVQ